MPKRHRDDCATLPREKALSLSLRFSQLRLRQSEGPQSSLTGNQAMQSTCHDRFDWRRPKFPGRSAFVGNRAHFYGGAASFLCGAQQLCDCKFYMRIAIGGAGPSLF
jgi:hypothetical protein